MTRRIKSNVHRASKMAAEGRQISKKFIVSSRSACLQCIVHARNRWEAVEMARARSTAFNAKDTIAMLAE